MKKKSFESFLAAEHAFKTATLDERLQILRDFNKGNHREFVAFQALFRETAVSECKAGRTTIGASMLSELRKIHGNLKMPKPAVTNLGRR